MQFTKSQILNRINKTNDFVVMEPTGPVKSEQAEMPILLVLKAIAATQGLEPGENCEITDYTVSADKVTLKFQSGNFTKESTVPSQVASLFAGDNVPVRDADFEG